MALNGYLTLTGETQGQVKGSVTQVGREDMMMVVGWSHEIVSPRDAASGLPTGKRQHKPLSLICEIDKATPVMYNILCNNENITDFTLNLWRPSSSGAEVQFYTIELMNANLARVHVESLNNKYPENMRLPELVTYEFTYQKITWTWNDGGITAEDDWETPRA